MIMFPSPANVFTPSAAKRWKKIPKWMQENILANVWCGNCTGAVQIVLETASMEKRSLILRGKCKTCGKNVCRLVEPEDG